MYYFESSNTEVPANRQRRSTIELQWKCSVFFFSVREYLPKVYVHQRTHYKRLTHLSSSLIYAFDVHILVKTSMAQLKSRTPDCPWSKSVFSWNFGGANPQIQKTSDAR